MENCQASVVNITKEIGNTSENCCHSVKAAGACNLKRDYSRMKPFINSVQKHHRVRMVQAHLRWTRRQWTRVLWSDETASACFGERDVIIARGTICVRISLVQGCKMDRLFSSNRQLLLQKNPTLFFLCNQNSMVLLHFQPSSIKNVWCIIRRRARLQPPETVGLLNVIFCMNKHWLLAVNVIRKVLLKEKVVKSIFLKQMSRTCVCNNFLF